MAEFLVKVADEQGHMRQQVEHGHSEAEIHDRFTQQGYLVYWVKPRTLLSGGTAQFGKRGKIKPSTFLIFNQQFLTLIKAGLPILTALDLLIKRQRDKSLLRMLENVRDRVKGGELLSDSFAAQQVFPKMYTTTLMAGEKSGSMEEVLGRYIAYQRMVQTFRKKLMVSLVYPALLVSVVTVMLAFLITYVVPKFAELFDNMGAQLPDDHRVHAGDWNARAEVWLDRTSGAGGRSAAGVALEAERPGRGNDRQSSCCRCRCSAKSG